MSTLYELYIDGDYKQVRIPDGIWYFVNDCTTYTYEDTQRIMRWYCEPKMALKFDGNTFTGEIYPDNNVPKFLTGRVVTMEQLVEGDLELIDGALSHNAYPTGAEYWTSKGIDYGSIST
jgi:hypothetical protein